MTEINKKNDLSVIPPTNNDGDPYVLPLDIFKEGYSAYNISNWFKARVGDNGTPFAIRWYSHGRLLNILGMRPFIEGQVGDYTIDDSDPDNPQINMAEDASHIHIVGDVDDAQEGGVAIYRLISQAFPKSGIFYGKIGFMGTQDDGTLVNTGVDIVFKVLAGHMNMLGARKFYVSELEKAWLDLQDKIKQYNSDYKNATQQQADQFKQDTEKALADLNTKIANEIKRAEDTLSDTQASIDNNLAALKRVAASVGALQAQLDADNLETQAGHYADLENLKADFDKKIGNMAKHPVQAFDSLAQLQAKYPNGTDGDFVTIDTGHIYIYSWLTNTWKDCGQYQGKEVANQSIDGYKLKPLERISIGAWSSPLIVDFEKGNLIVSNGGFHQLISFPNSYNLISGTISIITEEAKKRIAQQVNNAKTKEEKDQLAKKDIHSTKGGIFVVFNPNGADKLETQFKFYEIWDDIQWDDIYVGFIQFPNVANFIFPYVSSENAYVNGITNKANYLSSINAPRSDDYLYIPQKWIIDYDKMTITVPVNSTYTYKQDNFIIDAGKYSIGIKDHSYGVFLYLKPFFNSVDNKWHAKIVSDTSNGMATNTFIYLGWIDPSIRQYFIKNISTSFYDKPSVDLVGPDKPTVDWDNLTVKMPAYWHFVIGKDTDIVTAPFEIDLVPKDAGAYFIGIDLGAFDGQNPATMFKVFDDFNAVYAECDYFFGWVEAGTKTFKFNNVCDSSGVNTEASTFPWKNKKVTCLGDSITQGDSGEGGLIPSYVPRMQKWLQTMPANAGLCGSKITEVEGDETASFIDRMGSIRDQDVITIFGGINDFQWNAPLGKMTDSADNPTTFYGALKDIVITLSRNNPKAKLMFITPMKTTKFQYHTFDDNGALMKNTNGNTQLDFVNAIKQVADYYSIPVLDMYSCSNYSPYLQNQVGHDNFTADGLHPTAHGYERIAQQIAKAINNL